ncbi:hypothetical protein ACFPYI_16750 [Halomarina salina]|uniref:Twin-arginine translocation signal domain-containing protein n=1 Tax=Halomarina salina TaxID=1872699 RepID=A0ABD5RS59_9EURY|nr:hypothetical protein [Halomarina salina]
MAPPTRRRLLFIGGGLLTGAGCLSRGSSPRLAGTDGMDVSFEVVPSKSVPPADVRDDDAPNAPAVSFEADRIVVTGVVGVGSSKCREAALESVTYDEDVGDLRVVVVAGKSAEHPDRKPFGRGGCPDDYSYDWYRLVVSPTDEAVRRVTAVERNLEGTESSLVAPNPESE